MWEILRIGIVPVLWVDYELAHLARHIIRKGGNYHEALSSRELIIGSIVFLFDGLHDWGPFFLKQEIEFVASVD